MFVRYFNSPILKKEEIAHSENSTGEQIMGRNKKKLRGKKKFLAKLTFTL